MPLRDLSERERQVVALVARGCRDREIAFALGLAESTVKCHLAKVRRKLSVRNRADIVRLATMETMALAMGMEGRQ